MKQLTKLMQAFLIFSITGTVLAGSQVATGPADCAQFANKQQPFILVLKKGDNLLESITACAKAAHLPAASLSGLGQVHNPTLAYFSSNQADAPTLTPLTQFYELAALNGNITNNSGQYYTHAHAVLADKNFHGIAGHLKTAEVGLTAEITILPLPNNVKRAVDAKTGFGFIEKN